MAVVAREGSHLIKKHREQKERKKAMHKDWELAGSKMGQVLGVKSKDDEEEREDDETNFKVFDRHPEFFLLYCRRTRNSKSTWTSKKKQGRVTSQGQKPSSSSASTFPFMLHVLICARRGLICSALLIIRSMRALEHARMLFITGAVKNYPKQS